MTAVSSPPIAEVTTATELGTAERARWEQIRASDPALASPFFAFEFCALVSEVRRDVRVGILRDGGRIVGFLPFQAGRTGAGRPVGGKLSDYHGLIVERGFEWDALAVLRGFGLRTFAFNHLIGAQAPFRPYFESVASSPVVDFSRAPGKSNEAERKRRRLARDSAVRFELDDPDPAALRTLLVWKSAQYRRTRAFDAMSRPWVRELLERVHAGRLGVLSSLYADERLIAVHLGLRSGGVLHSWFPAYDVELSRGSPGLVLLRDVLDAVPAAGVELFDFGKGDETYKSVFANDAVEVGVGVVHTSRRAALSQAAWRHLLRTPLYRPAAWLRKRIDFR